EYTTEDNQEVNVAAYMEAGVEYAPVITTSEVGTEEPGTDQPGTDQPGNNNEPGGEDGEDWNASGGGCDAGFGALALAALAAMIAKKR
ncbi:MAG: SYNERG-CTERM sorting domain-containing protein, partial [Synergistaceae bacterium]|nr:SYNERG-CTERM sorting domain-containing protein [Synergistaceae bacterium]MBQ7155028.1 SYNERG-CTERM sorting domain-containing protein [Synergistaceae bacterium]